MDPDCAAVNNQLREALKERGGPNGNSYRALRHVFRQIDESRNKKFDVNEFKQAFENFGVDCTMEQAQALFNFYDTDGSQSIHLEEFVQGLRDPLNERMAAIVEKAFNIMD
jgi:Ca2+-binding EF-hand superfamily protein